MTHGKAGPPYPRTPVRSEVDPPSESRPSPIYPTPHPHLFSPCVSQSGFIRAALRHAASGGRFVMFVGRRYGKSYSCGVYWSGGCDE